MKKNILLFVALFLAACGEKSGEIGEFIRGCRASGIDYKSCSCLAEQIIYEGQSKTDPKILKKCIGKQDPEEMIKKVLISQRISSSTASCLAEKITDELTDDELDIISKPVLNGKYPPGYEKIQDKIFNIMTNEKIIKSCR